MLCTEEERQAKRIRVETFVDSFLSGLKNTASNEGAQTAFEEIRIKLCIGENTSAKAIKDARRELGKNDESYLQLSVMVLWSGEGSDENHLLYPASATTERDINASTLRSMASVAEDDYNQILKQLEIAKDHITYYLAIPEIRVWLFTFAHFNTSDNPNSKSWYVKTIQEKLAENNKEKKSIGNFKEQSTFLRDEKFSDVDMWSTMVKNAFEDTDHTLVLFDALSSICDPYNDVILDGLCCVNTDILKECDKTDNTDCDEFQILSNTTLDERYSNTQFTLEPRRFDINDPNNSNDSNDSNDSNFKCSFTYFDDNLEYCNTGSIPVFYDTTFKHFKELIKNTRMIEWIQEERLTKNGVDIDTVSEQQLLELCSSQPQMRALSSCFLSVSRGLTCSMPPHYSIPNTQTDDPYLLPVWGKRIDRNLNYVNNVELNVNWSHRNEVVSMWQSVYNRSKLLMLDPTGFKERYMYCKCLWTPTISKADGKSSMPIAIGNLSLNETSLATSYCTMLSELHRTFKTDNALQSTFVEAICKLEMLTSLRTINRYKPSFIQPLISSNGTDPASDVNLFWFHSTIKNSVVKQTGIASLNQFPMCQSLTSTTPVIKDCTNEWVTPETPGANVGSTLYDPSESNIEYRSTVNQVPEFASTNDLRECVDLLYQWKYNSIARARLERIKTRVDVLKESYQELLERGRQTYSNTKPKSDIEERERRNAIWADSLRELDISGDKFYRFLKDVAGTLHEDVTALIDLEDRSMEQNQRIYREQRRETLRHINSFSQRVMDTVISSVFRQSKLRADLDAASSENPTKPPDATNTTDDLINSVVVVSEESVQKVRELADGTSGLGFLEANQALQQFLLSQQAKPMSLRELLVGMRGVLDTYRDYAIDSLQNNQTQSGRASLEYLANPRNSYVVRIKNETFAAIRSAYLLLRRQLIDTGLSYSKLPSAYDCIEGDSYEVCNQFAQLVAYQLGHSRAFSSAASVYLGATPAKMNLAMLNISLNKTCNRIRQVVNNGRL
jgi:hypothetical protein